MTYFPGFPTIMHVKAFFTPPSWYIRNDSRLLFQKGNKVISGMVHPDVNYGPKSRLDADNLVH